jgi:hypothetical protein
MALIIITEILDLMNNSIFRCHNQSSVRTVAKNPLVETFENLFTTI